MEAYSFKNPEIPTPIPIQLIAKAPTHTFVAASQLLILVGPVGFDPLEAKRHKATNKQTQEILDTATWEEERSVLFGTSLRGDPKSVEGRIWILHSGKSVYGFTVLYIEETEMKHSLPEWISCSRAELPMKIAKMRPSAYGQDTPNLQGRIISALTDELSVELNSMMALYHGDANPARVSEQKVVTATLQRQLLNDLSHLGKAININRDQRDLISRIRGDINSEVAALTNELLLDLATTIKKESAINEAKLHLQQQAVTALTTLSVIFLPAMLLLAFFGINTFPTTMFGISVTGELQTILVATLTFMLIGTGGLLVNFIIGAHKRVTKND